MNVFITGTAGFIGFHIAQLLLKEGHNVHGYDGLTDYYDVRLKQARHNILRSFSKFTATEALLEDDAKIQAAIDVAEPNVIIHLAAQAGVRYSLENPRAYIDANIIGTFNVMEAARRHKIKHLLMASTSSVYGANEAMPYAEVDKADTQMSFYAATKKANEAMAHSYSHLHRIPTTMFRFFTVYGPWGRPDMALFKFTQNILNDKPIDIYNHGEMWRDFTYVEDLVQGIRALIDVVPHTPENATLTVRIENDSLSPVAPYRVINIGNSERVRLMDFVDAIEDCLGQRAIRNFMDMQAGDVPATWANAGLLTRLTNYKPATDFKSGVAQFVKWYREFYQV